MIKKITMLSTILVFMAFGLQAQVVIKGKVLDETNAPLTGASIMIKGTTQGTTADNNGNYSFTTNITGKATLVFSFVGFQTIDMLVDLHKGVNKFDVHMKTATSGLNEVVVTATNVRRTQLESPLSLTTFSPKTLQRLTSSSQADILRTVPGITAEGGGGEVASNIFIRGLPSGGQYQFTPIMIDGMPVISTMGMNSSAQDVYFRPDLGFRSLEFVRGGVSTLYGVGSVAGIISYLSKTGSVNPENTVSFEWADKGRYKAAFFTSGPVSGPNSKLFYAFTGVYRYDNGPIVTGLPTEGVQFRGNLKKVTKNGVITLYGQYIDDRVQFYLPLPLNGSNRTRAIGNDGKPVYTTQTNYAADIAYPTPGGYYQSPIRNGVYTKGGFLMLDINQRLGNGWRFDSKMKYARYFHQFNLFLDGSGVSGASPVETQSEYVALRLPGITNYSFTYDLSGLALDPNAKLFENRILDRTRPMRDMTAEFKFSKTFKSDKGQQTLTFGTFLARADAGDFDVITRYLGGFNNIPQLIDLTYVQNGVTKSYSLNGVTARGLGYTNNIYGSGKEAIYITDEAVFGRFRLDAGIRIEHTVGNIAREGKKSYVMSTDSTLGPNLTTVNWGNGKWTRGTVSTTGTAFALAGLYNLTDHSSLYLNISKGFFFPMLRSIHFNSLGQPQSYSPENIYQAEGGWKLGTQKLSATASLFAVILRNRRQVDFVNGPNGGIIEQTNLVGTSTVGIEATWNWYMVKNMNFYGDFTYQKHRYDFFEGSPQYVGNWLRRQPRLMFMLGLSYNNGHFDANISNNYTGKKYTSDNNAILLDPINIINADVGYTFPLGPKSSEKSWRLGVHVFNLLNSAGVTEGSPRLGNNQTVAQYFVGRPILPFRIFVRATFNL